MRKLKIEGLNELPEAAAAVLDELAGRSIVIFRGTMGAGKTTLIRAICDLLGVEDSVSSPTFALVNEYKDRDQRPIYHFDFYRVDRIEEAFDLGYEEYFFGGNLCLVEWPEKIEQLIPDEGVMTVSIEAESEDTRLVTID